MTPTTRELILGAALDAFNSVGFERATIVRVRSVAGVSNGSFFHFFASKEALAAALFLDALDAYQAAMVGQLGPEVSASDGLARLVRGHIDWVVANRAQARFLFEQVRSEWLASVRTDQEARNRSFSQAIERWRAPHVRTGQLRALPPELFFTQLIGPAQQLCRAWLSGRSTEDPRAQAGVLIDCALRALALPVASESTR